jgi:hypothetical protein
MTSSLKRRLDKLGAKLPTFEEWLQQGGDLYGAWPKGPPYPWREGTFEVYEKKSREAMLAFLKSREAPISPPNEDPVPAD